MAIDEDWLRTLSFSTTTGVRIEGLLGCGSEKVTLKGVLPDGKPVAVVSYKHHLGFHIREVPPFLSGKPLYDVVRVCKKLRALIGCGYVDSISSDYDRMFSSILKWLHTTHRDREDVENIATLLRTIGTVVTPAVPEALHFILASPGMKRRLHEIASLPQATKAEPLLMFARVNLPNFPIEEARDHVVRWAERMLRVQAELERDAPFEPKTLEQNPIYVWGAAAVDEFFVNEEMPQVAQFIETQFGKLIESAHLQLWSAQIDTVTHLMACFLERSNVGRIVRLSRELGLWFDVRDRQMEVLVPMGAPD